VTLSLIRNVTCLSSIGWLAGYVAIDESVMALRIFGTCRELVSTPVADWNLFHCSSPFHSAECRIAVDLTRNLLRLPKSLLRLQLRGGTPSLPHEMTLCA
jgi:hypothetical protein